MDLFQEGRTLKPVNQVTKKHQYSEVNFTETHMIVVKSNRMSIKYIIFLAPISKGFLLLIIKAGSIRHLDNSCSQRLYEKLVVIRKCLDLK